MIIFKNCTIKEIFKCNKAIKLLKENCFRVRTLIYSWQLSLNSFHCGKWTTNVEYLDILGGTGTPEGPAGVLGHYKSCPCQVDAESSLQHNTTQLCNHCIIVVLAHCHHRSKYYIRHLKMWSYTTSFHEDKELKYYKIS